MGFKSDVVVCARVECDTEEQMMASMDSAKKQGADVMELCFASLSSFSQIERIFRLRNLPSIVTFG